MVGTIVKKEYSTKKTFYANFIAGIGWGIGATVGLTLFLAVFTWILNLLGGLPLVGSFFADLIRFTDAALKLKQ
jgi:hypothetical protein